MGGGGKGGGGGGGDSTSTVYQNADPWTGQQPYLKEIFSNAQSLWNSGGLAPEYYPKDTLAPMSDATQQALALQEQRAMSGNSGMKAAQDQLASTMSGQYLNSNPFSNPDTSPDFLTQYATESGMPSYLQKYATESGTPSFLAQYAPETGMPSYLQTFSQGDGNPQLDTMVQRAIGQANAGVAGNFAAAGRYGSGAFNAAANDAAGNIATQMYGQAYDQDQNRALSAWDSMQNRQLSAYDSARNRELSAYNTERDNQIKGMMFAPQLAAADYQDIAALSEVGTARENYAQNRINADMDRYNYDAGRDSLALQNYMNLVNGNYGMSGSSTTTGSLPTARSNPLGGMLSGALGGAGLGSMMAAGTTLGGPMGALIGGVGGGLLGLF